MSAVIPLAKGYNPDKMEWPVMVSEKLDGVPIRIDIVTSEGGELSVKTRSRSGKPVPSVGALVYDLTKSLLGGMHVGVEEGCVTLVGELVLRENTRAPFKDVSGVVRRKDDQSYKLRLHLFDAYFGDPDEPFYDRQRKMFGMIVPSAGWTTAWQYYVHSPDSIPQLLKAMDKAGAEGLIARSMTGVWAPGKRRWDYQKLVLEPTMDLRIVGYEEAVSKDGEPLGMVGGLVAEYRGELIGIGPGKMTHAERKTEWEEYSKEESTCVCGSSMEDHKADLGHAAVSAAWHHRFPNRIAEIKYKKDDTYEALRQPTFQHWRPDKDEVSYD